jgi:hypothetical protein
MSVVIGNIAGTGTADVVNSALVATGPQDDTLAGFAMLATEQNAAGDGVGRQTKPLEADPDYRLRTGGDTETFNEPFFGSAINTGIWQQNLTTFTISVASNALTLNAGAVTTANAVARVVSYLTFPLYDSFVTYFAWDFIYNQAAPIANNTLEMGAFFATGTAAPTDGVFIRYNATGTVEAVVCFNSVGTSVAIADPTGLERHRVVITIYADQVDFWIDDVLVASINTPTGRGYPVASGALPLTFRTYNAAVVPALAVVPQIFNPAVSLGGLENNRDSATTQALAAGMGVQGQTGATIGSLANWANSAAPATASLSNTSAGYGVGLLGGQFRFAAPTGAETDYILFAFQVPAAAVNAMNKKFVCVGVVIDTWNEVVAVATTGTVLQWGISVGSTAASLATGEAATTKAARRFPVGVQSFAVADPVGKSAQQLSMMFPKGGELVANPGEFLGIILKVPVGTNTATETFRGLVAILGYWE